MDKWPIGVFASVNAGLGVHLDVARELGIPTVQLHAPHQETRTPQAAEEFLGRCSDAEIAITAVFGVRVSWCGACHCTIGIPRSRAPSSRNHTGPRNSLSVLETLENQHSSL